MTLLRPALAADAPMLAALHGQAFERPWSEADFEKLLCASGAFAWLAAGAGFILCWVQGDEAEVLTFAVAPVRRRQGLGAALLRAALAHAQTLGAERALLEAASDNSAALALYARFGFSEIGRRPAYYAGSQGRTDALVLGLKLGHDGASRLDTGAGSAHIQGMTAPPESTSMPERIENLCVEKGMRMTDQRRVIARVLSEAKDHPDVEEVHRRAAAVDEGISIATVYRTVRLFEEAGIIEKHDFRDGRARYEEVSDDHHDHLIDMKTGRVLEFFDPEIERLQVEIARRLGYRLVDHRLELYGAPLEDEGSTKG